MKLRTLLLLCGLGLASLGALVIVSPSQAQRAPLSEEHRQRIVANCTSAKASLSRLHRSDVLLRLDRGQVYEYISTKLMARLNSRAALARLDSGDLVAKTTAYEQALTTFRTTYQRYEERLSALLRANCATDPEGFYYDAIDVRERRSQVYTAVRAINEQIIAYREAFDRFAQPFFEEVKE